MPGSGKLRSTAAGFWLVAGVLAAVAVVKVVNDTLDPDCFWHLRVAEQLQRDGVGPIVDQLSFASIKEPWTPYSWLAELGMKRLWDWGGYQVTVAVLGLLAAGFVLIVAASCAEAAGPERRLNCVMAAALAACLALPYLGFRPATLAIVMLAAGAWLLLRDRRLGERSRAVWLIVPATALLINIHLTAVVVPMWVGCLLLGAIVETPIDRRRMLRYALLLAGTAAACLCTPMLPGMIRAGWHYQFQDVMVASGGIEEMRPIYATVRGAVIASVLCLLTIVALLNRGRVRAGEWIWLGATALLLLRLGRFGPIFASVAAPVLAAAVPALPDGVLARRAVRWTAAVALALGLAYSIVQMPGRDTPLCAWLNRERPDPFGYPCAAADFVERDVRPGTGRLINEFTWGGYLAWRLGDRFQVFADGRTQLYSAQFWRSTFLCDDATRVKTLAGVRADAAVLPVDDSVFRTALVQLGWKSVFRDERAEVMLPPGTIHEH